jgi:hypothetical protein
MSQSLMYPPAGWYGLLPTFCPTDFGLQELAHTTRPALRIAKVLVSGLWR